jgi:hypothetical protein
MSLTTDWTTQKIAVDLWRQPAKPQPGHGVPGADKGSRFADRGDWWLTPPAIYLRVAAIASRTWTIAPSVAFLAHSTSLG